MAAKYVVANATKKNMKLAANYVAANATKENAQLAAQKGMAGLKWANQKADEHGINKQAVVQKVGAAMNSKMARNSTTQ